MAEAKKKKKSKKFTIGEEDMSLILRKYSVTQVLDLLREVKQYPDAKINWKELVKRTSTGIKNARELQMLWRHLAYRSALEAHVEDEVEPLDDDSDLESELEACPPVSGDVSAEAAACAKVLLASGSLCSSGPPNSSIVEAPFTVNIPNGQASLDDPQSACAQGTNITVPISIKKQKQPIPIIVTIEGTEGNKAAGGGVVPAKRKRKPWTEEEDLELIAAVAKCGERNWANIIKGDFKGDRTASQLSQRWAIIKRKASLDNGGLTGIKANSQLSEQQLANRAVSHALNMSVGDGLSATKKGSSLPVNYPSGSSTTVPATTVVAGSWIAAPSTKASLLKSTQSLSTIHIKSGGSYVIKAASSDSTKPMATNQSGPSILQPSISKQEPSESMEPPVLTGTLPPATATTSSLAAQKTISIPPVTSCETVEGKKEDAISTVKVKEENISPEELKENLSGTACNDSGHNEEVAGPHSVISNGSQKPTETDAQNMEVDEKDQPPIVNEQTNS